MIAQVVVAAETGGALGGMVRQLSIDQFENEGRRVSYGTPESATAARKLLDRQMSINSVPKKVCRASLDVPSLFIFCPFHLASPTELFLSAFNNRMPCIFISLKSPFAVIILMLR